MIENCEMDKIVLYMPGGNMMHKQTTLDHLNTFLAPLNNLLYLFLSPSIEIGYLLSLLLHLRLTCAFRWRIGLKSLFVVYII